MTELQKTTSPRSLGAVLFDLDGTLADTAPDLGAALNRGRSDRGLMPLPLARLRAGRGGPRPPWRGAVGCRREACLYGAGPRRRAQPGAQRSRAHAAAARAASPVCFARRARVVRRRQGRGAG